MKKNKNTEKQMEFDKSKIYTALNAEDLPIGSLCIFANTVESLRKKVQHEDVVDDSAKVFARRFNDGGDNRFVADGTTYNYAYLIKLPVAPQYKPFSTVENIFDAAQHHGILVKEKNKRQLQASYQHRAPFQRFADDRCRVLQLRP